MSKKAFLLMSRGGNKYNYAEYTYTVHRTNPITLCYCNYKQGEATKKAVMIAGEISVTSVSSEECVAGKQADGFASLHT